MISEKALGCLVKKKGESYSVWLSSIYEAFSTFNLMYLLDATSRAWGLWEPACPCISGTHAAWPVYVWALVK